MKNVILAVALFATLAQAGNVVHYDQNGKPEKKAAQPNYPNDDLYVIKK